MIYGYARCSTNESKQDINRQVRELKQAGAEQVYLEYEHGDAKVKAQLSSLLETATEGDAIITLEVSRLARSTKQLCEIIDRVREKRLRLVIVGSITVDCSNGELDPMTNAFIQMSGVFAELELRIIRSRVRSGMANAKAKGVRIGRPQKGRTVERQRTCEGVRFEPNDHIQIHWAIGAEIEQGTRCVRSLFFNFSMPSIIIDQIICRKCIVILRAVAKIQV